MVQSVVSTSAQTSTQSSRSSDPVPRSEKSSGQGGESNHIHKLLILVSAPLVQQGVGQHSTELTPVPKLDVWDEIDEIVSVCNEQQVNIAIKIEVRYATTQELIRLNKFSNTLIIHYIGHGVKVGSTTALLLEDEDGLAVPVAEEEFKQLLKRGIRPCQLAFLNACYSQTLAQLFADYAQVPHVIGIHQDNEVRDAAARIFSRELYPAVLKGESVNNSFLAGYKAVRASSKLAQEDGLSLDEPVNYEESKNFCLLPRGSHDKQLNLHRSKGKVEPPKWGLTNLYTAGYSLFFGRQRELHEILCALHRDSSRCVLVHGFGGIGKTALAEAVGFWEHHRKRWIDGVWMIELRGVQETGEARNRIAAQISSRGNPLNFPAEITKDNQAFSEFFLEKESLLILDDLDDLLQHHNDGISSLLNSLLKCRKIKIIITSRRTLPFTVMSYVYDTPKMTPEATKEVFESYAFSNTEKVRPKTDYVVLDKILTFLDGYPFAIRLAASYIRQTYCNLSELWHKLNKSPLNTLQDPTKVGSQSRDTSLRVTLNISYEVLSPSARRMFTWLALYPSGLSKVVAEYVFGEEVLVSLQELVSFSMAEQREDPFHRKRFSLPEPARSFAEIHQEKDQVKDISIKALKFYLVFAENNINMLFFPDGSSEAEKRLLIEQPNLRRFLEWGYENESGDGICYSARITALLTDYLLKVSAGNLDEMLRSYPRAKDAAIKCKDLVADALLDKGIGDLLKNSKEDIPNKIKNARQHYEQSLQKFEEAFVSSTEILEQAGVCLAMGDIYASLEITPLALQKYEEAKELYESLVVPNQETNLISFFNDSIKDMLGGAERLSEDEDADQQMTENGKGKGNGYSVNRALMRIETSITREKGNLRK